MNLISGFLFNKILSGFDLGIQIINKPFTAIFSLAYDFGKFLFNRFNFSKGSGLASKIAGLSKNQIANKINNFLDNPFRSIFNIATTNFNNLKNNFVKTTNSLKKYVAPKNKIKKKTFTGNKSFHKKLNKSFKRDIKKTLKKLSKALPKNIKKKLKIGAKILWNNMGLNKLYGSKNDS